MNITTTKHSSYSDESPEKNYYFGTDSFIKHEEPQKVTNTKNEFIDSVYVVCWIIMNVLVELIHVGQHIYRYILPKKKTAQEQV